MHFFGDFLGRQRGDPRRSQTVDDVLVGLTGFQWAGRDVPRLGEQAARHKQLSCILSSNYRARYDYVTRCSRDNNVIPAISLLRLNATTIELITLIIIVSPDILIDVARQVFRMFYRWHHVLFVILVIQSIQDLLPHAQLLRPIRQFIARTRKILKIAVRVTVRVDIR